MFQTVVGPKLAMLPEGEWVRLKGTKKPFVNLLRRLIKPASNYYYDTEKRAWMIYWKNIPVVVDAAKRYFAVVDWSALPDHLQMYAAGGKIPDECFSGIDEGENPFQVLFVLDDAPNSVVKAAFRALCMEYHPDRGGDEDKMAELVLAYESIKKLRGIKS